MRLMTRAVLPMLMLLSSRAAQAQDIQIGEAAPVASPAPAPSASAPDDTIVITAAPTPVATVPAPRDRSQWARPRDSESASFGAPYEQHTQSEERESWGRLARAGVGVLASSYGLTLSAGLVVAAFSSGSSSAYAWVACLPILGPLIDTGLVASASPGMSVVYLLDSLTQAGGLAMLVVGVIGGQRQERREARTQTSWNVFPTAPGATLGLSLSVTTF